MTGFQMMASHQLGTLDIWKIIADLPSQILQKMEAKRTSAKVPIIHSTRSPELSIYYVVTILVQGDISSNATSTDIWDNIELM